MHISNKGLLTILIISSVNIYFGQSNDQTNQYDSFKNYYNTDNLFRQPAPWSFTDYTKEGKVDPATGKFGLSLPIHNIAENDFELPIGISYATSGVKVNQNSSEVGMNWELFAGGSISRVVNGVRDEIKEDVLSSGTTLLEYAGSSVPSASEGNTLNLDAVNLNIWTTAMMKLGSMYFVNSFYNMQKFNEFFPRIHDSQYYQAVPSVPQGSLENIPQSAYEIARAQYSKEYQRDIFRVNVGSLNFSFALIDENPADNFTSQIAVPLDDKGIKIEYERKFAPTTSIFNQCDNCQNTSIFTKFIVTDKKGVKYYFEDYEIFENEYVYNFYQFPIDLASKHSPWIVATHPQMSAVFSKKIFQHLMKSANVDKWNLTKIELPNGKRINFTYTTEKFTENSIQQRKHDGDYLGFSNNTVPKWNAGRFDKVKNTTHKKYINAIFADDFNTRIYFEYSNYRPDYRLGGKNLSQIRITDIFNKIGKQILLEKEFSNAEVEENFEDYRMFLSSFNELKITDRSDSSNNTTIEQKYKFNYTSPESLPQKNFLPYTDLYGYYLGNRGAAQILSNLAFPKVYLYPTETDGNRISYEQYEQGSGLETSGVDRRPKSIYGPIAGTLNEIIFPTKGSLKITYEANTYFFNKGLNKNPYGPGVRVKKLEHSDSGNIAVVKEYFYDNYTNNNSSGNLLFNPSFAYLANHVMNNQINQDDGFSIPQNNFVDFYKYDIFTTARELELQGHDQSSIIKKMVVLSNMPMGPQSDIFGREIIYTNVLEKMINVNNSSESFSRKYYTFYEDNSTEVNAVSGPTDENTYIAAGNQYIHHIDNLMGNLYPWRSTSGEVLKMSYGFVEKKGKNIFPFPDRNYFDLNNELLNGKIKTLESLDATGTLVKKEEYIYEPLITIDKPIHLLRNRNFQSAVLPTHVYKSSDPQQRSLELNLSISGSRSQYDHLERYRRSIVFFTDTKQYFQRPVKLKSVKSIEYFPSGNMEKLTTIQYSTHTYDPTLVRNTSSGNGDVVEVKTSYINDITNSGQTVDYGGDLIQRNMVSIPLLKETTKNSKKIEKIRNSFSKDWSGHELLLPHKLTQTETNTIDSNEMVYDEVKFESYDSKGNLLQYSKTKSGVPTAIIWGYNNTQPIAKIEGASYGHVINFASDIIGMSNADIDSDSETNLINSLDAFRINDSLKGFQITTYTYDPLIGITSITDTNGLRTYYKYNSENKLEKILNVDGRVLKEFKYNTKQ